MKANELYSHKFYKYYVLWKNKKGEIKIKDSNSIETMKYYAYKFNGTIYIDTRFDAKMRLQRIVRNHLINAAI